MKIATFLLILLGVYLSPQTLNAALFHEMDPTNLIHCNLSSRHHNRICVENKKIKKILYASGDIEIRLENDCGHLFVQPMVSMPACTTVSIITTDGTVQDLELSFSEKSSEILILQPQANEEIYCEECLVDDLSDEERLCSIQCAIQSILAGVVPEEYYVTDLKECFFDKNNGLLMTSSAQLVGVTYTIYLVMVENRSRCSKRICERSVNFLCGEWVWNEKECLRRGERGLVLIGVKNNDEL